ncbi:type II secretion system F family protein [Ideonella sp. DXS22W]|uniref:General secretion pathway protein F n=1 Tax=Pseudaquabacterium inlustre TaxID=2984192 RepID=A0ABU9CKZ5_9BURK
MLTTRYVVDAEGRFVRQSGLPGADRFDRALFAEDLAGLLQAGLSLHEALGVLAEGMPARADRARMQVLRQRIVNGLPVSRAMGDDPAYGAVLVALVQAGERSSGLAEGLARYAAAARRTQALRQQLQSALVYPTLLLAVALGVVLFLLGWMVPQFATVVADADAALSPAAQRLVATGRWLGEHRARWLGALGLVLASLVLLLCRADGRARLLAALSRWPGLQHTLLLLGGSRFFATVGMLTQAGLPLTQALELAQPLLLPAGREHLRGVLVQLRTGRALADCLDSRHFGDPVVGRLLEVGQRTGDLPATLARLTLLLEARAARRMAHLSHAFEPALMLLLGGLIGGVVLLMYVPLLELSSALQ